MDNRLRIMSTLRESLCKSIVLGAMCFLAPRLLADTFGLFTYTNNGTTITITGYATTGVGAVTIPDTIVNRPQRNDKESVCFAVVEV